MFEDWMIVVALFAVLSVVLVMVYGRQGRWRGAVGWMLTLGGQVFLALGGGDLFAWAGLAGMFVSGIGVLLIVVDIVQVRGARR
jgi:hypothetical protein